MKIYTKTGDYGETSFIGGERVRKSDPRIEVYGTLDELNSMIGVTISFMENEYVKDKLEKIQHDLFTLGAELASLSERSKDILVPKITEDHIWDIETTIDEIEDQLPLQNSFILPGGSRESAFLHLCRTVTRRSEREMAALNEIIHINASAMKYINRLSDLFYVLARFANGEATKEQQPIYKYFGSNQES